MELFLIFFFLLLSSIGKAVYDTLRYHFERSIFAKYSENSWVNPSVSWKNKWKFNKFWDLIFSTVLVWTTDLSHFAQHIYLMFLFASMIPFGYVFHWYLPLIMYVFFTGSFQIFFWIFDKK